MTDVFVEPSMAICVYQNTELKNCLEGKVLQGCLFKGFKGSLCELVKYQRKIPRGDASATLRSVSMEPLQEMSEMFFLAVTDG